MPLADRIDNPASDFNFSPLKKILIIKPSSLGDVVHALPAVALVRDAYPEAEITWVINPEFAPLL